MSAHANPDIVDDGLVFIYDTDDGKSYKGEPTTNLITSGGIDFSERSGYTNLQTSQVVDSRSPSGYACEMEILDGANINSAARSSFGQGTSMPSSGNAFVSILAKFEGGASSNITPKIYNGSGTAWQSLSPLDGGSAYLTSGYRRFGYYGAITANPGFSMAKGNSNKQTGQKTRWHSPQVELKSHATPFVNGTRSATQGLIDRTGTATIDISNASFDSNAQMTFDGTDDYIDLPNDLGYTTATTAIAWFKRSGDAAGGYQIIFGGQELEISIPTSNGKIRTGTFNGSTRFVNEVGSGLLDNNWHQVAVSLDNATTTKIAYIDGIRVGTQSFTGSIVSSFSNRRIGRYGSSSIYYANSYVPIVHIYNRALTDDEIAQNYNATKSRFA